VVGGARSGTTWIAELLNYRNEYRYMWEPLSPHVVPAFAHFRRGQYLRPGNQDPAYRAPLLASLTGQMRHRWIDHLNTVPFATRRLVKDVFANLVVKWVQVNLPGIRIIYVLRHPLAVIASRIDAQPIVPHRQFDPQLERFLEQADLLDDFLAPFESAIRDARGVLEQHAWWWCIENYVPLRQFSRGEVYTLCYEALHWAPEEHISGLASFLGREFDPVVYARMRRPSRKAGYGGSLSQGRDPATAWRTRYSREEVRRVLQILGALGLDQLYDDSVAPRVDPSALSAALT
jgi:hypothetical protein